MHLCVWISTIDHCNGPCLESVRLRGNVCVCACVYRCRVGNRAEKVEMTERERERESRVVSACRREGKVGECASRRLNNDR